MQTLSEQMGFYAAYHQDARNKATHFLGVPMIVFGLWVALGYKPALRAAVQKRARELREAAGIVERTAAASRLS